VRENIITASVHIGTSHSAFDWIQNKEINFRIMVILSEEISNGSQNEELYSANKVMILLIHNMCFLSRGFTNQNKTERHKNLHVRGVTGL
jgi:hypothetical protein